MSPLARRRRGEPAAPFVVGVGRSGTTLLRLMLDAHPQLAIPAETHFIPEVVARSNAGGSAEQLCEIIVSARNWGDFALAEGELRDRVARLERADAAAVLRAFYELYAEAQGKPRWGDKTPAYVTQMRLVGDVLAEARFIHLIRDGRDVTLSRRRRGMGADKPIAAGAEHWKRRISAARTQSKRLRGRYLELRYEDLVADPEPGLRAICELCELEFDAAMLSYHERAGERLAEMSGDLDDSGGRMPRSGSERLASHALTSQPPSAARVGGWRTEMSPEDQVAFGSVAGDLLAELGYDR